MTGAGSELMVRLAIIIALTDLIEAYYIMKNPSKLTWTFVILVIIVTLVPIMLSVWWVVAKYNLGW